MKKWKVLSIIALVAVIAIIIFLVPVMLENSLNITTPHEKYAISERARRFHQKIVVADLHTDSLLWKRDLTQWSNRGHVDVPRMQAGNVTLQLFTAVTKSPAGQNYESNNGESDNITSLVIAQLWPIRTWDSLIERALYQAEKLSQLAADVPDKISFVTTHTELQEVLTERSQGKKITAAIYGIEGAHALEGELSNLDRLFTAGLRVVGLTHFFDNLVAGSLHGTSGAGLTDFGRRVVLSAMKKDMIIDVAHLSPQGVSDVLLMIDTPVVLSHGGMKGACDTPRNLDDELMKSIAAKGGLIGIGFWDGAACDTSPTGVVKSIRYAIDMLGVDHVALGSDYDGSTEVEFDISELAVLTHTMIEQGFSEEEIEKVMGGNTVRFFLANLPK
ncbi:MAG: membrane dipeptidase [Gammaproteobacteria bacterium]|jgi:membrane dipeptidase